jgi:hypothetical protein
MTKEEKQEILISWITDMDEQGLDELIEENELILED